MASTATTQQNLAAINREFGLMRTLVGSNIISFLGMNAVMGAFSGSVNEATQSGRAWSSAMFEMEAATYGLQDAVTSFLLPVIENITPIVADAVKQLTEFIEEAGGVEEVLKSLAVGEGKSLIPEDLGGFNFNERELANFLVEAGLNQINQFGTSPSGAVLGAGGAIYNQIRGTSNQPILPPGPDFDRLPDLFNSRPPVTSGNQDATLDTPALNQTPQALNLSPTGVGTSLPSPTTVTNNYVYFYGNTSDDTLRAVQSWIDNGAIQGVGP